LQDVTVTFGDRPALEQVSFHLHQGARLAVVGPNGAGKSTLFKALVGLLPLQRGRILIHGLPLGAHRECVAYVPQREAVDWRFPVTVEDVVMMGRFAHLGWWRRPAPADRRAVRLSLEQMGIAELARESISGLSGGQQQRVFLARALAQEPHILLMDEPFTGVDIATQEATLELLAGLRLQQVTMLISTHDLNLAARHFDQAALLNRRLVAFGSPAQVFTPQHLRQAFGGRLMVVGAGEVLVDDCCPPEPEE
jgi:ABC-type Mn2+/Zn2+ transport system ATPase subunit